jgi:hypothetical protein
MPSQTFATHIRDSRLRTLGVCWIVYGVISLIEAILLFLFSGTATVMFGALLVRVPDPFTLMSAFHSLYVAAIVVSIVCGIAGILAGLVLGSGSEPGRTLALVAGFLALWHIPAGLALGIYTLVVLLPSRPAERYVPMREAA